MTRSDIISNALWNFLYDVIINLVQYYDYTINGIIGKKFL